MRTLALVAGLLLGRIGSGQESLPTNAPPVAAVCGTNASPVTATPGGYVPDDKYKLRIGDRVAFQILEDRDQARYLTVAD